MKKALFKEIMRSIRRSKARFISIIAIVALGISFFAGIKATAPDMKETAELYFKENNLMDVRVISPVGLTQEDIEAFKNVEGVETVMPSRFVDGILKSDGKSIGDIDGSEMTCRAISLDFDKAKEFAKTGKAPSDYINRIDLLEGQWPSAPNEVVVDCSTLSAPEQFEIGATFSLSGDGTNIENKLKITEFKIVGIIRTPTYISFERGNTNIGSGKLGTFVYASDEIFNFDYYTEAYIKVAGAHEYSPYSEDYSKLVENVLKGIKEVEKDRLPSRITEVRAEIQPKVADGAQKLAQARLDFDKKIADGEKQVEELKHLAENGREMIDKKKEEFNASLSDAQREIYSGTNDYNANYKKWREKQDELNEAKLQLAKLEQAQNEYNRAVIILDNAKLNIGTAEASVKTLEDLVANTESALEFVKASHDEQKKDMQGWLEDSGLTSEEVDKILSSFNKITAVGTAEEMIAYLQPMLEDYKIQLKNSREELQKAKAEFAQGEMSLDEAKAQLKKYEGAKEKATKAEIELAEFERKLNSASMDLELGQLELTLSQQQLKSEIDLAETKLAAAEEKAKTADEDFKNAKAEAEAKLRNSEMDYNEAKALLESLDTTEWMIQDRDDQPGYSGYEQTADRMGAFAQVFPIFFFLVAAMVCLTTMTRMVEEERTQLGTLKALGYSNFDIVSKYLIYSLSASLIGSIIGLLLGLYIFPKAIFAAYGIMYDLPPCVIRFKWSYAIIGTIISLLSTSVAALFACYKELKSNPSKLMRPKAPKAGKRIVLERIPFLWSKMNFTSKVTARNLFRNKRRILTTIVGVAGCTALLLTGFGLGDSIRAIMDKQFGNGGVCNYDVQIVLSDEHSLKDNQSPEILNTIKSRSEIDSVMMNHMEVTTGYSERTDEKLEINLLVPDKAENLSNFVKLNNRKTGDAVKLNDDGAVISEKLAQKTDTGIGDEIIVLSGDKEYKIPVSGIVENYTFHYVYVSPALYEKVFGTEPMFNYVTAILADNVDTAQKENLAVELMKDSGIDAVAYTTQIIDTFGTIIDSLNLVVGIFIVAAGALALVVLYNLSNINLNERTREVATIKVLGFRDREASSYILRENVILTIVGVIIGLLLGVFLHQYVVSVAEIDVVMFGRTIKPLSYLFAVILSFIFSTIVNLIMHRKLNKVDLVGSLKAVE